MTELNLIVSIVVAAYTIERYPDLTELLDSIQNQTYRNFETIVVTERSAELYDKLKNYIKEKGYTNTRILFNQGPWGLSPARNMGIKAAKGDIIAFIDDDAVAFPDWLEQIIKTFTHDSVIGVTGFAFPLWEDESMKWFPEEFYWIFGCSAFSGLTEMKEVRNAWGANMAFTKEAFELSGLFDEKNFGSTMADEKGRHPLMGDDTEFSIRVKRKTGGKILYNPDIKIRHKVYRFRFTSEFIRRYSYRHAYSKAIMKKVYQGSKGETMLASEQKLLKRILFRLLPTILIGFFTKPVISWRRLSVTTAVLFYTALGYIAGSFHNEKALEAR